MSSAGSDGVRLDYFEVSSRIKRRGMDMKDFLSLGNNLIGLDIGGDF